MPRRKYQLISVRLEGQRRKDFAICPSAQAKIKHDLNQALAKKTIASERERSIAERALLATAIEMAREEGTNVVRAAHVRRGWRERLSITPGCEPPRSCLRRSVMERLDKIAETSQVFRQFLSEIE